MYKLLFFLWLKWNYGQNTDFSTLPHNLVLLAIDPSIIFPLSFQNKQSSKIWSYKSWGEPHCTAEGGANNGLMA